VTYWLKIAYFSYPSLIRCPRSLLPLEFWGEVYHEETRVMRLSYSEDHMIVAGVVLTQCQRVTDRQADGFTIASSTALCIASYADALEKHLQPITLCLKIPNAWTIRE